MDFRILDVLTGGATIVALSAALAFLLRNWILERLKAAISFEYEEKLQTLKLEHNQLLEHLREERAEREALRSMVLSSLTSTQSGILGHRLQAIQILWKSVRELREAVPTFIFVIDMLGYQQRNFGQAIHNWLRSVNPLELATATQGIHQKVFDLRPFVGEDLYALFFGLQAAYGQATTETIFSYEQGMVRKWHEDSEMSQLLEAALDGNELKKFDSLTRGNLEWLRRTMEEKIILKISHILSGQSTASDSLTFARQLIAAASTVSRESQDGV